MCIMDSVATRNSCNELAKFCHSTMTMIARFADRNENKGGGAKQRGGTRM